MNNDNKENDFQPSVVIIIIQLPAFLGGNLWQGRHKIVVMCSLFNPLVHNCIWLEHSAHNFKGAWLFQRNFHFLLFLYCSAVLFFCVCVSSTVEQISKSTPPPLPAPQMHFPALLSNRTLIFYPKNRRSMRKRLKLYPLEIDITNRAKSQPFMSVFW